MKTNKEIALRLFEIALELQNYRIDNGPMGEDIPFQDNAIELQKMAKILCDKPEKKS